MAVALAAVPALAVAASMPKAPGSRKDVGAEAVFREARSYTVRIRTRIETPFFEDEQGSSEGAGFLVDAERRWIVTNAHVVGQSPSVVEVAFADEPFQPAQKVYVDPFTDMAVLVVDKVPHGRATPDINCDDDVRIGEPVGAFGHPLNMYFTGTRGIVSNRTDQDGPDLLQIDATVNPGNSGGPVIALGDGRVLGIATSGVMGEKSDRLNFATPMKDVCRILSRLRQGVSPSPPRMEFALLKDEDGSHTMIVGRSFDSKRWPLEPNDRIIAVGNSREEVNTLSELVSALRGAGGPVPLTVDRNGQRVLLDVIPAPRPLTVARRGLNVDGALIAPAEFDDEASWREPWRLMVHSVESGSTAELVGFEKMDVLESLDGLPFTDIDSLSAYLRRRPRASPFGIVFRRISPSPVRVFDYNLRELPGNDVTVVGGPPSVAALTKE